MYKKSVSMLIVFLLVLSTFVYAQEEDDNCSGFFGSIKCFLIGDASQRPVAGSAWYDRGVSLPWYEPEGRALVGTL